MLIDVLSKSAPSKTLLSLGRGAEQSGNSAYRDCGPGDHKGLGEAVHALRESVRVRTREAVPLGFASSQNNLGYALIRLGEFENDARHFEEAIRCFRSTLKVRTREAVPSRRVDRSTESRRCACELRKEGEELELSGPGGRRLYGSSGREGSPSRTASLGFDPGCLGTSLLSAGEWGSGTESLEAAVKHFNRALEQYRDDIVPFARAGIEFNLGTGVTSSRERENSPALVSEALEHHAAACRNCLPYSPYWALEGRGGRGRRYEHPQTNV